MARWPSHLPGQSQPCLSFAIDPQDFARSQGARRNTTAAQNAIAIAAIYAWRRPGKPSNPAGTAGLKAKTNKELADLAHVGERTLQQAKEGADSRRLREKSQRAN